MSRILQVRQLTASERAVISSLLRCCISSSFTGLLYLDCAEHLDARADGHDSLSHAQCRSLQVYLQHHRPTKFSSALKIVLTSTEVPETACSSTGVALSRAHSPGLRRGRQGGKEYSEMGCSLSPTDCLVLKACTDSKLYCRASIHILKD